MKAKHMQISQNGYRHDCWLYVLHGNCDLMKLIGDKKLLMISEICYYFMRVIHPASQKIIPQGTRYTIRVDLGEFRFRCKILTLFSISSTSCINLQSQLLFFAISNHSCNSLSATGGPCSPWPVNVARHLRKCAWYGIIAGFDRLNTRHDDNGRVTTNTTEKKNIINYVYSENNLEEKNLNSLHT